MIVKKTIILQKYVTLLVSKTPYWFSISNILLVLNCFVNSGNCADRCCGIRWVPVRGVEPLTS